MPEQDSVFVLLARLEGKLDAVLAGNVLTKEKVDDHEIRIRAIEARPYITPWKLWSSLLGTATFIVTVLQIINWFRGA